MRRGAFDCLLLLLGLLVALLLLIVWGTLVPQRLL